MGRSHRIWRNAFPLPLLVITLIKIADTEKFLAANGPSVQAIATSGHDGVPDDLLDNLSNLKIISNYGVGYDAINVDKAVSKNILVTIHLMY